MKTGLAVAAAALVLVTGCGGNRVEAPPQPAAAPAPTAEPQEEKAAGTPAAPSAVATTTTTTTTTTAPTAPVATDRPLTVTDVAGNVIETVPPTETRAAATPPSPAPPAPKAPDPLEWMKQNEERRADYQKQLAEAEAKVVAADASIAQWQNTILAFKNPFRPRPALAAEDAQAVDGKDGVERVSWAEGKMAEAKIERDAAQRALDDLRANPPSN